jgi:hypothetical protein
MLTLCRLKEKLVSMKVGWAILLAITLGLSPASADTWVCKSEGMQEVTDSGGLRPLVYLDQPEFSFDTVTGRYKGIGERSEGDILKVETYNPGSNFLVLAARGTAQETENTYRPATHLFIYDQQYRLVGNNYRHFAPFMRVYGDRVTTGTCVSPDAPPPG